MSKKRLNFRRYNKKQACKVQSNYVSDKLVKVSDDTSSRMCKAEITGNPLDELELDSSVRFVAPNSIESLELKSADHLKSLAKLPVDQKHRMDRVLVNLHECCMI
jgi:hypothetical protein